MPYIWQWGTILPYTDLFVHAALVTLGLSGLAIVLGCLLGLGIALLQQSLGRVGQRVLGGVVEVVRAIPVLILLIWIHYVLPLVSGLHFSAFQSALVALSLNLSVFLAETIRAGIVSIPRHQWDSGLALGLHEGQVLRSIILPQTLKNVLPNLVNLSITQIKNSALASVIGVNELLHQGNLLMSNTFRPLEVYTATALVYTVLILPFAFLGKHLERRLHVI